MCLAVCDCGVWNGKTEMAHYHMSKLIADREYNTRKKPQHNNIEHAPEYPCVGRPIEKTLMSLMH